MDLAIKSFSELSIDELYALLKLRTDVFVVEQNCPYPELDDKDQIATHIFLYEKLEIVAYARVFAPSDYFDDYAAIGRIVTHKDHRDQKLGRKIVNESLAYCRKVFGEDQSIKIAAQTYLTSFYESFGFNIKSDEFLEDGIPHFYMVL